MITLADGQEWRLAEPVFRPSLSGLTEPNVDRPLDRIFENSVLNEPINLSDLFEVARNSLKANYNLTEDEIKDLLSVSPGEEAQRLGDAILDAMFVTEFAEKTFTAWVRASLLVNGLGHTEVPARDLLNVMTILVATNRTIPLSRFADACRLSDERVRLEMLL